MKKFSFKISARKYLQLLQMGLSSQDIAIFLDEIRKEAEREKKVINND